jgi:hypothetical protein
MKKIGLTIIALFCITFTFAQNVTSVENAKSNIDINTLTETLDLKASQLKEVKSLLDAFNKDIEKAVAEKAETRDNLVDEAVAKGLDAMYNVLNDKQYTMYMAILNESLTNRGLLR